MGVGGGDGDGVSATSATDATRVGETDANGVGTSLTADHADGESGASGTTDDVGDHMSGDAIVGVDESTSMVNGSVNVGTAAEVHSMPTTLGEPLEYATALKELVSLAARLGKFDLVEVCRHLHSFFFFIHVAQPQFGSYPHMT